MLYFICILCSNYNFSLISSLKIQFLFQLLPGYSYIFYLYISLTIFFECMEEYLFTIVGFTVFFLLFSSVHHLFNDGCCCCCCSAILLTKHKVFYYLNPVIFVFCVYLTLDILHVVVFVKNFFLKQNFL